MISLFLTLGFAVLSQVALGVILGCLVVVFLIVLWLVSVQTYLLELLLLHPIGFEYHAFIFICL